MRHHCPTCGFARLPYPPRDYHICPCCGTEFGADDAEYSYKQLREMWIAGGANWFFGRAPSPWNPWMQLILGGHAADVPPFAQSLTAETDVEIGSALIAAREPLILSAA